MDYSKFKLKPEQEILSLLKNVGHISIITCRKCCKEFTEDTLPECGLIAPMMSGKLTGCTDLDFLCNTAFHEETFKEIDKNLPGADVIGVFACGIGVQAVANRMLLPVFSLADSISQGGQQGLALDVDKCNACAQCYLSLTGGICPIVNCAKQLVNGQCGGAKNGKCEVSKDKDCAWEKITDNLKISGFDFTKAPVQTHKHNKPDFKTYNNFNNTIREKRKQNFYGGLNPFENKEYTSDKQIQNYPVVEEVVIPLAQHIGAICEPLVKAGDYVKVGQKIGDSKSFISAPVHSSISGKVVSVEPQNHPVISAKVNAITIKTDGKNTVHESVVPCEDYNSLSKEKLIDIIREKGIVGLGGAQFPTYVKLKSPKPIDTLILNGCECEPYITADERMMLEYSQDIISGIRILLKILEPKKCYFAIEKNKPSAIKTISDTIKAAGMNDTIELVELVTKYPQGSERMLISKVAGKEVPLGGLPLDVGVVVNNVSTAFAIYEAVVKGMPVVERVLTVTGDKVKNKMNLRVKIGTSFNDILEYCQAEQDDNYELKMGGPMMGILNKSWDVPVIKGTTCLLYVKKPDIEHQTDVNCIKCGRCVDVCPMELYPLYYWYYHKNTNKTAEGLNEKCPNILSKKKNYGVVNCIECRACEYICASKLPLLSIIKDLKNAYNTTKR